MTSETAIASDAPPGTGATGAGDVRAGARLRRWTLQQMLTEPVRDLLAVRGRGASALLLGPTAGDLERHLLALGIGRVLDEAAAEPAVGDFDLVLLPEPSPAGADEPAALRRARELTGGICAIVTDDRISTRDRAREAGFASVSLVQPPADAERSFVLLERALLIARPGASAEEPSDG